MLHIEQDEGDGFTICRPVGELDAYTVNKFREALGELANRPKLLIDMSEVEWEHEKFFREKCESHWLWKVFPSWPAPPPKDDIRAGVLAATR